MQSVLIMMYSKKWKSHQNSAYWSDLKLIHEDSSLSNTIIRNRSLQRATFDLHWKRDMHEDEQGALLHSKSVIKIFSLMPKPKLQSGRQDEHDQEVRNPSDHHKAYRQVTEKLTATCRLQNTRHAPLYSPTTGHESQRKGQKVDSAVWGSSV